LIFLIASMSLLLEARNSTPAGATPLIAKAAETCAQASQGGRQTLPVDAELYFGAVATGQIKPLSSAPELVKRFASTNRAEGLAELQMIIHFAGGSGHAWAVIRRGLNTCDLMITGFEQGVSDSTVVASLNSAGWSTIVSRPATSSGSVAQYLLTRMQTTPDAPAYGIRALIKSIGFDASSARGVQMEINFRAGDIQVNIPTK
jgi:hypothetical protein